MRNVRSVAALFVVALVVASLPSTSAAQSQPSYDTLRIEHDGVGLPYQVWADWRPLLISTPDNGAWVFFSADAAPTNGIFTKRLYAARFDPTTNVWNPAQALPGNEVQFGPSAAVDNDGVVHLVYTDRVKDARETILVYTRSDGQGGWTDPVPVAPDPNAGLQLFGSLAFDKNGRLHVLWQDQRNVPLEARQAVNINADIYASELGDDGAWAAPTPVSQRPGPDTYSNRPKLVVDNDRLIAVWSVYDKATRLQSASRVAWSTRTLDNPAWGEAETLLDRGNSQIGGYLVDVAPNPAGGAVIVYGKLTRGEATDAATPAPTQKSDIFVRRLPSGANGWEDEIPVATSLYISYPAVAVGNDGVAYVTYEIDRNRLVHVGANMLAADADQPGPQTILTQGEPGSQYRPAIMVDPTGKVWVCFSHKALGARGPNEFRCLRGARVAT